MVAGAVRTLCALLVALAPLAGFPQDKVPEADARAMRAVVEAQLEAFRSDDAERAFSYATEGIRAAFRTPENFMAMVRSAYPVVYRPRSVAFEPAVIVDGTTIQPARMVDAEGRSWLAIYPMARQPDGRWLIDGCQLGRLSGEET